MIRALFLATAFELFVGGGGRLLAVGPVTLRMVLFAVCVLVSLVHMSKRCSSNVQMALALSGVFLAVHLPSVVFGMVRGAPLHDLWVEFQPMLYWLIAPFFALALGSYKTIWQTASVLKTSAAMLAIAYLAVIAAFALGLLNFSDLYEVMQDTGEFFFRGESLFFYKGFLFLGVGCVFLVALPGRWSIWVLMLVATALMFTLTRGFIVSTAIAVMGVLVLQRRWRALLVLLGITVSIVFAVWVVLPAMLDGFSGQRDVSNEVRTSDWNFMTREGSGLTLMIGEGLGAYINDRLNIENTYLWIVWKFGFLALVFWLLPLALCAIYVQQIDHAHPNHALATAFMGAVLLIYVQTAANPYLNNPIGLSMVLISTFALRTLKIGAMHEPTFRRPRSSSRHLLSPASQSV